MSVSLGCCGVEEVMYFFCSSEGGPKYKALRSPASDNNFDVSEVDRRSLGHRYCSEFSE